MSDSNSPHWPDRADHRTDHLETRAVHAGQEADPSTGAIIPPVYMTSTYVQQDVGQHLGYDYSRTDNPTRHALEVQLAALEDAREALVFSSGMAAISTVLQTLSPGDHVICVNDVYGGTYRLFNQVLRRHAGLQFTFVAMDELEGISRSFTDSTKLVWVETPTNPLLNIIDIRQLADLAHERGARLAVDNTFATPVLQRPLSLGADVVAHSVTKYLGGHSDVVGGALALNDSDLARELRFLQNAVGAIPGPMDCWLVTRGIKTLPLRVERHSRNALAIASMLEQRDDVVSVRYPWLPSHPQYALAQRQMSAGGGMVSFRPAGGVERSKALATRTHWFRLAESLGGVESLIELPGAMTHQTLVGSPLEVPEDLVRLSVGIEHVDDLCADLEAALDAPRELVQAESDTAQSGRMPTGIG